jgi:hypothetical protein
MKNLTFKVLGELSNEEHKALLIEIPDNATENLPIQQDGTVETHALLKYLIELSKLDNSTLGDDLSLHEEIELMLNIYDPKRAVKFNNTVKIKAS